MTVDVGRERLPVGFVGLGAMGLPMVTRLVGGEIPVAAFDADQARVSLAVASGASGVGSMKELGHCAVVVLMLPDSRVVTDVLTRTGDGLFSVLSAGSLIIDMGSTDPTVTRELAAQAEAHDLELVDAPVSGGVRGAVSGRLAVMFGGSPDQLERAMPILSLVGTTVVRAGRVGAGHALKALNNLLSATGLLAAVQALAVGKRFGLEPEVMLAVINSSSGRNHSTETKCEQFVMSRKFDSGFAMRLMVKDLETALRLVPDTEGPDLAGTVVELWRQALELCGPGADHTEIARLVEDRLDVILE